MKTFNNDDSLVFMKWNQLILNLILEIFWWREERKENKEKKTKKAKGISLVFIIACPSIKG